MKRALQTVASWRYERVLTAITAVYFAAAGGLLYYSQLTVGNLTPRASIASVQAVAATMASASPGTIVPAAVRDGMSTRWLPLTDVANKPSNASFEERARVKLLEHPSEPYYEILSTALTGPVINYALAANNGKAVIVELPLRARLQTLKHRFHLIQISLACMGLLLVMGFVWSSLALRGAVRAHRQIVAASQDQPLSAIHIRDHADVRNLLPLTVIVSLAVFGLDLQLHGRISLWAGYVVLVLLSLRSSRRWHTNAITVLVTALSAIKFLILLEAGQTTTTLIADSALAIFAIWSTALLGGWNLRRTRNETTALAEAAQAQKESKELRRALERLNLATVSAGIALWEMDVATSKLVWDENRPTAFGLDAVSGEDFYAELQRITHAEDRMNGSVAIREALTQKQDFASYRYRLLRADGTVRHMQNHIRILRWENGAPRTLLGATMDITSEAQTAQILQRQAEQQGSLLARLNFAARAAGVDIYEWDVENDLLYVNEETLREHGEPGQVALRAKDFAAQQVHPDDLLGYLQATERALRSDETITYRYRGVSTVQVRHFQVRVRAQRDIAHRVHRVLLVSWDITEEIEQNRKLTEQADAVKNAERRLERASLSSSEGHWELDLITGKMWHSSSFSTLLGYEGRPVVDSIDAWNAMRHPQDVQRQQAAYAEHIASGNAYEVDVRLMTHGGEWRWFRSCGAVERDELSRPVKMYGSLQDVHQQMLAENALHQARQRFERAIRGTQDGLWELDLTDNSFWCSPRYEEILGYGEGEIELTAQLWTALVHPDDLAMLHDAQQAHAQLREPLDIELRMCTKEGEYRWMRLRGDSQRTPEDQVLRIAGSIQDISERRATEARTTILYERLSLATQSAGLGICDLDLKTSALYWDDQMYDLVGVERDTPLTLQTLKNHLQPENVGVFSDTVIRKLQSNDGQQSTLTFRINHPLRGMRVLRMYSRAFNGSTGTIERVLSAVWDVTEEHRAAEELRSAKEAAELATRAKSAFLANVSHEIRTPMNGIIGMTGLLLETALDRTQRDYSETIRASADSLLTVINDILDFSKIEAGKLDIESLDIDLRGNVEDIGAMMAFQAAAKNLELIINVQPEIPDRVMGDPQRIRQCLINLLGNAIKFTTSGEIVVEVCALGQQDGKVLMHFEVRDTGMGIAPETLKNLFQPFVQADSSTTRHYGGTGLGLSIVRRLVEMMGGQVGVASERGKGSTFWFTLPLEPLVFPVQSGPSTAISSDCRRILIVDDNETNRRVLAGQLEHAGYEVSLASGGSSALLEMRRALGDNRSFDVVLADFQMPDMDGAMLGEQINADPHLSRARIVMLTSMDRHGDIHRFGAMGFAGFLTKPVRARELFKTLDRVLARESRDWHLQSQPIITRGTLTDHGVAERFSGSVLLVEDHPVNQKVAQRYLERMGCTVQTVGNGAEGVAAFQASEFDLVLMDLQMPVMDGLTATRTIRQFEGQQRRVRTPIIALTANAMTGQLERCLEAGMDAYLTKPLEISRLREVLDQYGLAEQGSSRASHPSAPCAAPSEAPVDAARLAELTQGDAAFTAQLVDAFITSSQLTLREMQTAIQTENRPQLAKAAHRHKGASASVYAVAVKDLAAMVEGGAAAAPVEELHSLVGRLRRETERAIDHLQTLSPAKAGESVL